MVWSFFLNFFLKKFCDMRLVSKYCLKLSLSLICSYWIDGASYEIIFESRFPTVVAVASDSKALFILALKVKVTLILIWKGKFTRPIISKESCKYFLLITSLNLVILSSNWIRSIVYIIICMRSSITSISYKKIFSNIFGAFSGICLSIASEYW